MAQDAAVSFIRRLSVKPFKQARVTVVLIQINLKFTPGA
jgi:hypothetical protein